MAEVKKLIDGYKKFYKDNFIINNNNVFGDVQKSQNPKTLVIACSDSRVDPAILTNAEIGDIFVIRNVANIVPPYQPEWKTKHGTSAALEFAVNYLKVKNIVILGHSDCGGIKALVNNDIDTNNNFSFITDWVKNLVEIKNKIPENVKDKYVFCEKESIKLSMDNLLTFPWINEKVKKNDLKIHGWYFSIKDASLSVFDDNTGTFNKIEV